MWDDEDRLGNEMTREEIVQRIVEVGVVPVIRASSPKSARAAVDAVAQGGIPVFEITMTVPNAVQVIRELTKDNGAGFLIGAGTVLDADAALLCLEAGAQFLVSPGLDVGMIGVARKNNVPVIPGALTPTEIMAASRSGADFIKIFPCSNVGGPAYLKALRGPFPKLAFIPTGGVNLDNAADFIRAGATALGVGGELVDKAALESGKTDVITNNARRLVSIVQEARSVGHAAPVLTTK
jgi:2-dehydro-3-deoxyphosphogluconate aldolase / (4S)-4-hydroxy-2-oxoglutarate aldolase